MKSCRDIKIALNDESELWKDLCPRIFSTYFFELPSFPKCANDEKSANLVPKFIPYEQSLVAYNEIGNNPYMRPFLYLYVFEIKNDEISEETIDKISRWIETCKILGTTYLFILIQEVKKIFGKSVKPINIEQITGSIEDENDFIIFQVKQKKPISDQIIETVRNATKAHLVLDCQKYESEIQRRLKGPSSNPKLHSRLTVWYNLLLYFYGFYQASLDGFTQNYENLINNSNIPLDHLISAKINPKKITDNPFTETQEPIDTLMFAFQGALAISFAKILFENMLTLLNKHISFMRSKCQSKSDEKKVNSWFESAIKTISGLKGIMLDNEVASKLLFKKFELLVERNGEEKEITEIYKKLRDILPPLSHELAGLDTRYLEYISTHKEFVSEKDYEETLNNFNEKRLARPTLLGWQNVTSSLEQLFDNFLLNGLHKEAQEVALKLISNHSTFPRKKNIINKLIESGEVFSLSNPFDILIDFESDAFNEPVIASSPFSIKAKIKLPPWMPLTFEVVHLFYLKKFVSSSSTPSETKRRFSVGPNSKLDPAQAKLVNVKNPYIEEDESPRRDFYVFDFETQHIKVPGVWALIKIGFRYGKMVIHKDITSLKYCLVVNKSNDIPVSLAFPTILKPPIINENDSSNLTAILKIDYTNVASKLFTHHLYFVDDIDKLIEANKEENKNLSVINYNFFDEKEHKNIQKDIKMNNETEGIDSSFIEDSTDSFQEVVQTTKSKRPNLTPLKLPSTSDIQNNPYMPPPSPRTVSFLSKVAAQYNSSPISPLLPAAPIAQPSSFESGLVSSKISIPEQQGTATFSDGTTVGFQIDENGKLTYNGEIAPPFFKQVSIPFKFTFNTDRNNENEEEDGSMVNDEVEFEMPNTTALVIDNKLDTHKWQIAFVQSLKFPLLCRCRLLTDKVVHIELHNASNSKLTIKNITNMDIDIEDYVRNEFANDKKRIILESGQFHYLIHTELSQPLRIIASDNFGKPILKVWKLDKTILAPKLNIGLKKQAEYPVGSPISLQFDLPKCSYKFISNDNFVIVGKIKDKNFDGGSVSFQLIPIMTGIIETPHIRINGIIHTTHPTFITAYSHSSLSYGPLLTD